MMKLTAVLAALLVAPFAQAATQTHRCTQSSITVNESERFLNIEMQRRRNLAEASVGAIVVYGSWKWSLPHGIHRVEFAPFEVRKTIRLPIDDDLFIGTQTTTARCGPMRGNVPAPHESQVALTVLENEPVPTLSAPAVIDIRESNDWQTIEIPVSLDVRFGRGGFVRAQADPPSADIEGMPVLFDPDETTGTMQLRIRGNHRAEPDREVRLLFSGDVPTKQILLRIADDDRKSYDLAFDQEQYSFREATPSLVTITRTGDLAATFEAQVRLLECCPSVPPVSVIFAAGETSKTVELPVNDTLHTGDRDITLELHVGDTLIDTAQARVADDDGPIVSIRDRRLFEGTRGQQRRMNFAVQLSERLRETVVVRIASADGTATRSDYVLIHNMVGIPPGFTEWSFDVYILGDDVVEPDETFTVSITQVMAGPAKIGNRTATGTILNDDEAEPPSTYRFEELPLQWNESQKWLTATVVRENRLDRASSVTATLTGQSSGRLYAPVVVEFAPNETRKDIRFFIDDRFHSIHLGAALLLSTAHRVEARRNLTIAEDEPASVVSIEDVEITEGATDAHAELRITVEPPTDQELVVRLAVPEGNDNFRDMLSELTIGPFGSGMLSVPIIGDGVPEQTESFQVRITEVLPPYFVPGKAEATCTIHDDDVAGAHLSFASEKIARGATTSVTLHLDAPAPTADVIRLSAAIPGDLGMPETVAIAAGATSVSFDVTGLRAGVDVLRVDLPSWLGNARIEAKLLVYTLSLPVLPDLVRIPLGETVQVSLALAPPSDHDARAKLATFDWRIAEVDSFVLIAPGGNGTFEVYGGKVGRTTVEIVLPAEVGSTTVNLPIEVY